MTSEQMQDKLQTLRRYHRQNVFNDGANGERHARALRRLGRTETMRAMVKQIEADREHRASERLLRMYA